MMSRSPSTLTLCLISITSPIATRESLVKDQALKVFDTIKDFHTTLETAKTSVSSCLRRDGAQISGLKLQQRAIEDAEAALQGVKVILEPLRLELSDRGGWTWKSRAKWVALDKKELHWRMSMLKAQHQNLRSLIEDIRAMTAQHSRTQYVQSRSSIVSNVQSDFTIGNNNEEHTLPNPWSSTVWNPTSTATYAPNPLIEWKRKMRQSTISQATSPPLSPPAKVAELGDQLFPSLPSQPYEVPLQPESRQSFSGMGYELDPKPHSIFNYPGVELPASPIPYTAALIGHSTLTGGGPVPAELYDQDVRTERQLYGHGTSQINFALDPIGPQRNTWDERQLQSVEQQDYGYYRETPRDRWYGGH